MEGRHKYNIANYYLPIGNQSQNAVEVTYIKPNYLIFHNPKIGSSTIHNIRNNTKDSEHYIISQNIPNDFEDIENELKITEFDLVNNTQLGFVNGEGVERFNNHIKNPNINKVFLYRNPFIKTVSGIIQDFKHELPNIYSKHPNQSIYNKFFKSPTRLHFQYSSQKSRISYHEDLYDSLLSRFAEGKQDWLEMKLFLCDCFEIYLEDLLTVDNHKVPIQSILQHASPHSYLIYELLEYGNIGLYEQRDIVINLDNPNEDYKINWLSVFNPSEPIGGIHRNSRVNDWWLWENVGKTKSSSLLSKVNWLTEVLRFDVKFYNLLKKKYPFEQKLRYYHNIKRD